MRNLVVSILISFIFLINCSQTLAFDFAPEVGDLYDAAMGVIYVFTQNADGITMVPVDWSLDVSPSAWVYRDDQPIYEDLTMEAFEALGLSRRGEDNIADISGIMDAAFTPAPTYTYIGILGDNTIWGYDGKQFVHKDTDGDNTPDTYIEVESAVDGTPLDLNDTSLTNDDIYDAANDVQLFAPVVTGPEVGYLYDATAGAVYVFTQNADGRLHFV